METDSLINEFNFEQLGGAVDKSSQHPSTTTKIVNNIFGYKNNNRLYEDNDQFYHDVYEYYYKGGYTTIIFSQLAEILSLIFGIVFSIFLFILLDWGRILQCGNNNDIQDCGDISLYITPHYPNIFCIFVMFCASIHTVYKILLYVFQYKGLLYIHNFYKEIIGISLKDLKTTSWSSIINEIANKTHTKLSVTDITNIILRKENYYIALFSNDIITLKSSFYTHQLDINLKYIILSDIHNLTTSKLKRKLVLYGIFNILLSIFIFIYLVIYFCVSNIDDFNSHSERIGSRRYSPLAKLKFREYNELKHFFEKRTNKSIKYANEYLKQFPSPVTEIICKFICLICGAFICFFLVLSVLDESVLLYVRMFDRSLIFYMGIIGTISSFSKGFIRPPEHCVYIPNQFMKKVAEYTHYMPFHWIDKCNTHTVKNEFLNMFPYIIQTFLYDLASVVITPFILIFVLPYQSSDIVNFIKLHTTERKNVGYICTFAEFNNNTGLDKKMESSISFFNENHSLSIDNSNLISLDK